MYGNLSDLQSISYLESRPDNLIGVDLVHDLVSLVDTLYTEPGDVRVVVIDSASPEFFSGHVDLTAIPQYTAEAAKAGGPGDASLGMFLYKLAHVPVITIAKVRGRARGGGNELALACDMIFASRENAIFGPFESGTGALPGAGGIQHLTPRLGRTRAIEAITGADDFDADLASPLPMSPSTRSGSTCLTWHRPTWSSSDRCYLHPARNRRGSTHCPVTCGNNCSVSASPARTSRCEPFTCSPNS